VKLTSKAIASTHP